ncbi:MAG: VCBS repeat-containing protein, partial [Chitinophagaceae bacterium]
MNRISVAFLLCAFLASCHHKPVLFNKISSSHSGITFNNRITENDTINPISMVNIYNGAGVGVADFNNDGLQDLYFTGNQAGNELYLNKGNLKFEDITSKSGTAGLGRWARGAACIDINNDGLMDIYVSNSIFRDSARRTNILYVNQGVDKNGVPHFTDMAAAYGLNVNAYSTMANFFDYDNDGDLDLYLTVNGATAGNENKFGKNGPANIRINKGRLYRNDWNASLGHPFFTDVSVEAGVNHDGFGHAATVADINRDGWKDIYISNDFLSDDILYINNHDGTFTDHTRDYFKHTSLNSMGQDIIDINNDGLSDIVELDMNPRDNYRKKMMLGPNNYNIFQNFDTYNHQYQYVRNTLQLNQGTPILENDSIGTPVFSEIGFMSGISQTDWSWTPLVQDFDNDGFRDLVVTNGFPKDVTDHDFIAYRRKDAIGKESNLDLLKKIPEIKLANFAFKNTNGIHFEDVSFNWGLTTPCFSNGAVYADLDNDGDMDMVMNNTNDEAFIYENTVRGKTDSASHFLQIKCIGSDQNINGIGTMIDIYYDRDKHQAFENTPYRGYLSTNQDIAHFGLGKVSLIDSVVIRWPGEKKQVIKNVKSDQVLKVNIRAASETYSWLPVKPSVPPLFKEINRSAGIDYTFRSINFIDFNIQTTLPHKLSDYCPAIAVADVDGNGLDDMIVGGNTISSATVFRQQADGKFLQSELSPVDTGMMVFNDEGLLSFDANGDGKPDLYISGGGYKYPHASPYYQDRLYINDGKGRFTRDPMALPVNHTSKLCVKAMDYDNDGRLDLFVSGRVYPGQYPRSVSSFIFRNESQNGVAKFTDVTSTVAKDLNNIGMVCDALFTDFDNDQKIDLIVVGEWMSVTFFKNTGKEFVNVSKASGINGKTGWWNSIIGGDFRHSGLTDYVVGNTGLNTLYQADEQHPVSMIAKDFDKNGSYVPIASIFLPANDGTLKEFPAFGRDDIMERIPSLKKRFDNYKKFADATMD